MQVFSLLKEQAWNPKHHVEKILGEVGEGDVTVACWEPGQISPYHCHPDATEIYFCFEGGGKMRTPRETVDVVPGSFVVHPPGELHEYTNGSNRKVPSDVLGGLDGDAPARTAIEDQDRAIAEKSGVPPIPIKNVRRSGGKG